MPHSRDKLYALINSVKRDHNVVDVSPTNTAFGSPEPNFVSSISANSVITLTAIADAGYSGSRKFYYDRLTLTEGVNGRSVELRYYGHPEVTSDVLPIFNETYGLALEVEDIVVEPVPAQNEEGSYTVVLQANAASLAWMGEVTLIVWPIELPLDQVLTTPVLDGLDLPDNG